MPRRRLLLLAALSLGGCGFALRRPARVGVASVRLTGFELRAPLAQALAREIEASGPRLVDHGGDLVLRMIDDERQTVAAASTAAGEVRELTLRRRIVFEVADGAGKLLISRTELTLSGDISYAEPLALAKQAEADALFRDMEADLARQLVRRLAALRPVS